MNKFVSKLLCGVTALLAISAAHAGAIDDAVKRGTLKVGMDPTYMPFEMTNKRGQIIGFEVDLLKAMAKSMGVSPYPFAMMVAMAASAAFMTPVSSPVNTLVLGPGNYRFSDFVKLGVPFTVLVMVVCVILIPVLFPF